MCVGVCVWGGGRSGGMEGRVYINTPPCGLAHTWCVPA